jgi:hypothetical protein
MHRELRRWALWVAGGAGRAAALCLMPVVLRISVITFQTYLLLLLLLCNLVNLKNCHIHLPIQLKDPLNQPHTRHNGASSSYGPGLHSPVHAMLAVKRAYPQHTIPFTIINSSYSIY